MKHKEIQLPKTNNTLQLDCIATLPQFSGKGLFSKLINHVENHYFAEGGTLIEIQVWKQNKQAVAIYLYKNYSIIAERKSSSYEGNGKILMQKKNDNRTD